MLPFMFQNPQSIAIKKYLFEMLKDRYPRNENFIDRIVTMIQTKEDYERFSKFMADVFETGFIRAVDEYRDQFTKMGMKVGIVAPERPKDPGNKIFNQSEKSG